MERSRLVKTAMGWLWYVMGDKGLLRCTLPCATKAAAEASLDAEYPEAAVDRELLPELAQSLQDYFSGARVRFDVRLDDRRLTDFQRQVYRELRKVRAGRTLTYGELAARVGRPGAARGVGVCMRKNPFPPIVPCHRVLGASGALTGFSAEGGIELKRTMLTMEGVEGLQEA